MNIYKRFETDPARECDGIKMDIGPGIAIWIARAGGSNRDFTKASRDIMQPYAEVMHEISDAQVLELNAKVYARAVVRKWEGVTDREGSPLEHNEENVTKILVDLPDLFTAIRILASDSASYRLSKTEHAVGNSGTG